MSDPALHRSLSGLDGFSRDVRFAIRQLRSAPAFALAALLCLGIGIGATTAIYSVVNTILFRPLPFPESDRLVRLAENVPPAARGRPLLQRGITFQEMLDWRAQSKTLSDAYGVSGVGQRVVRTAQGPVGLWGTIASANAFSLLRVSALIGRTLDSGDEVDSNVVVLSYDTWQRYFNSDPSVVGTAVEFRAGALLGATPPRMMTIVGVLPKGGALADGWADFYWPMPRQSNLMVSMIGKLAPGVSLEAALAEANAMGSALRPPWPANADPLTVPRFELVRLKDRAVDRVRPALQVFLGAVVVVLLIACANVANLLLARGSVRRREIATRFALGASRARVVRQVMTESLVLALAGGVVGAVIGAGGVALVKQLATIDAPGIYRLMFGETLLPRVNEIVVDARVFAISFALAAITSVLCGVLPALTMSRSNHASAMGARGASAGRGESRLRAGLVIGQLSMATVLLVCAGLLANSFVRLSGVNSGYDPSNVLAFNLLMPNQYSIAQKASLIDGVLTRLRTIPAVQGAGFARHGLLIGEEIMLGTFVPPGRSLEEMKGARTRFRAVSDGYLTAMGVPLLDGRDLSPRDEANAAPALVMSRSAASRHFGSARAVGQTVDWHFNQGMTLPMTVVGVVEDLRQESPTDEVFPEVFADYRQVLSALERWGQKPQRQDALVLGFGSVAVRTSGDPATLVPLVREAVNGVDANVGLDALVPMTRLAASAVAPQRFYAVVLGVFAIVAGSLAAIGIYGVLAYAVVQRTQEIGIRMAVGAQRRDVLSLILGKGLVLTTAGIVLGVGGAVVGSRLLQGLLFGVTPLDPVTFAGVAIVFGLAATMACYLPARRATRVDALIALRNE
jgi:putative ABC transport system permease protein